MFRQHNRLAAAALLSAALISHLFIHSEAKKYVRRGAGGASSTGTTLLGRVERDLQYYTDSGSIYTNYGSNDDGGYYTPQANPTETVETTTNAGEGEEAVGEEPGAYYSSNGVVGVEEQTVPVTYYENVAEESAEGSDREVYYEPQVEEGGEEEEVVETNPTIDNEIIEEEIDNFEKSITNEEDGAEEFIEEEEAIEDEEQSLNGFKNVVPPKSEDSSTCPPMSCSDGTYLKPDCTCTFPDEDPCNACPEGTRCQRWPEPMCIDCACGFCSDRGDSCCESDGLGSCALSNSRCADQTENFPAFLKTDNVCGGVETADEVLPYGCGCLLSSSEPCEYDTSLQDKYDDRCYVCTVKDLAEGECEECAECLSRCDSCIENKSSSSVDYIKNCLGSMDGTCRTQCNDACKKEPENDGLAGLKIKLSSMGEKWGESLEDIDVDEMLAKVGLTKAMVYGALPFAALVLGGMMLGCFCSGGRR